MQYMRIRIEKSKISLGGNHRADVGRRHPTTDTFTKLL